MNYADSRQLTVQGPGSRQPSASYVRFDVYLLAVVDAIVQKEVRNRRFTQCLLLESLAKYYLDRY